MPIASNAADPMPDMAAAVAARNEVVANLKIMDATNIAPNALVGGEIKASTV